MIDGQRIQALHARTKWSPVMMITTELQTAWKAKAKALWTTVSFLLLGSVRTTMNGKLRSELSLQVYCSTWYLIKKATAMFSPAGLINFASLLGTHDAGVDESCGQLSRPPRFLRRPFPMPCHAMSS
jgi:hypothetical protein